jgi:hypothetical protein
MPADARLEHRWRFFSAGGFDQVKLENAADLRGLATLDQKLWVALACPTAGLEIDARTLALIDTDGDGRVRANELIAAANFACDNLKTPDDLFKGAASLPLAAINDATPEGKTLLSAARQILANVGKPDATALSPDDLSDPVRIFAGSAFNGDGIITDLSPPADDVKTRADVASILSCMGGLADRSGVQGIDQPRWTRSSPRRRPTPTGSTRRGSAAWPWFRSAPRGRPPRTPPSRRSSTRWTTTSRAAA